MEDNKLKLKNFISKYGYDYLEDGTKRRILKSIDEGDEQLILEILQSINPKWIERVKELGKFYIFTDYREKDNDGNRFVKDFMEANYIDSALENIEHIPTLRSVKPRIRTLPKQNEDYWLI